MQVPTRRQRRTTIGLLCVAACLLVPASALAQRDLHWDRLDVAAHLEADGRLVVTETQTIVFTGDWNGGERTFDIRPRQQLLVTGVYREDSGGVGAPDAGLQPRRRRRLRLGRRRDDALAQPPAHGSALLGHDPPLPD